MVGRMRSQSQLRNDKIYDDKTGFIPHKRSISSKSPQLIKSDMRIRTKCLAFSAL